MKKIIPLIIFTFTTLGLFAQCDELFISEYVEGYGNNRALEIYNPTSAAVDLSEYSIGRFSNGGVSYVGIQLPAENLAPYQTYVAVLDKRDSLGTGLETPVWNGFQLWDYCTDQDTGDTLLYADGDTIFCVQYNQDGLHLYGTEYNEWLDLEGKGNGFFCPVYNVNNAMYFNGNDAVALVKGLTINGDGSNVLDVIGVVGEDPGDAWVDADGGWLTRDKTLEKKSDIQMGSGPVISALQDTFQYVNYNVWGKNNFFGIGSHGCTCDPDFMTSTEELNQIAFNIFPNPTSNELWVEAQESIERVEIYNLLGERVLVQNYGMDASNKTNILLGNLEIGMYVISLFFDGDHQSTQKFIKK